MPLTQSWSSAVADTVKFWTKVSDILIIFLKRKYYLDYFFFKNFSLLIVFLFIIFGE